MMSQKKKQQKKESPVKKPETSVPSTTPQGGLPGLKEHGGVSDDMRGSEYKNMQEEAKSILSMAKALDATAEAQEEEKEPARKQFDPLGMGSGMDDAGKVGGLFSAKASEPVSKPKADPEV